MLIEGQHLGDFEIIEHLGQGGMGAVFKARQTSLRRDVALKTLKPFLSDDEEYVARFHQEAISAAALNHPNLVHVYAAGEAEGIHYIAMEFVDGESAQKRLDRKGRIEPAEAIAIGIHVANALGYAWHRTRIIHRDIKPDNIFLSGDGDVKLGDLGLAKSADQTHALTMTGASMGTPNYISPEQAEGRKDIDLRSDIYSLGCTLYHLLTGQTPYHAENAMALMMKHVSSPLADIQKVWPDCPAALAGAITRMMQKDPAARYQNYEDLSADLRRAYEQLGAKELGASSANFAAAPAPPARRKPVVAWVAGGVAVAAIIAGAALWWVSHPGSARAPRVGSGAPAGTSVGGALPEEPASSAGAPKTAYRAPALPGPGPGPSIAATKDEPFVNTLGMKFVPVPIVSGPSAGQRVLFSVWDTRVQDYTAYATANKVDASWTTQNKDNVPAGREINHPVVGVSWDDAQAFCKWLTEKESAEGKLPKGWKYRLPSDEEWSRAVGLPIEQGTAPAEKHGKNSVDFPWGKEWPPKGKVGNYADETFHAKFPLKEDEKEEWKKNHWIEGYTDGYATTSPVGSYPANAYGLYDMGGNVWQWSEDWLDASHKDRVLRGASWDAYNRGYMLSSNRNRNPPSRRDQNNGFRCVVSDASARPDAGAPAGTSAAGAPDPAGTFPGEPATSAGAPKRAGGAPALPGPGPSIAATKDAPFVNTLGMKFVPVPIASGPSVGQLVLFSIWDTRAQDYATYAGANKVDDSWTKQQKDGVPAGREVNHPVVGVSWEDAQAFCKWLTEKEVGEGKLPKAMKYRLPTDEEWSSAVGLPPELGTTPAEKTGKNGVIFPWGKDYPPTQKVGNYADEAYHAKFPPKKNERENRMENQWIEGYNDGYATTSPVGSFPANAYGLYDMGGNVWQWCEVWSDASQKDRVLRGASWDSRGRGALGSSIRAHNLPSGHDYNNGFRCVVSDVSAR